jgi:hypothetical protein
VGLLIIPQLIYEHGEPCSDDDVDWGKLLTCPPKLSGNPTSRVIWEQVGGMHRRSENFSLQAFPPHLQVIFLPALKYYEMTPGALFPI